MDTKKDKSDFLFFKKDKERYEFRADVIQSKIMDSILEIMEEEGVNKTNLAEKMGVSNSFITQLFTIDKRLNFTHLAQLEDIFNRRIRVKFDNIEHRVVHSKNIQRSPKYGDGSKHQFYFSEKLNNYIPKSDKQKKHAAA